MINPAHSIPVSDLLDQIKKNMGNIVQLRLAAIVQPSAADRKSAWDAAEKAANKKLTEWDYFNHPEITNNPF